MPETILVPVDDDSDLILHALAHVSTIARLMDQKVLLVGIVSQLSRLPGQFADPVMWDIAKGETRAQLNRYAERLMEQGIEVETDTLEDTAAEALVRYAEARPFALIVLPISSDHLSPLVRATLALTTAPILVVRPNSATATGESIAYRQIMVPLDGSQRAECVLPLAATLARISGAQLLLAHVIRRPEMPRRAPTSEDAELAERVVERNREESERYLEQLRSRYAVDTATRILVDDNVAAALHNLAQQENVDLVVLCAHGYSGEPRWPFGSIADNLINYYDKSMVIVQDLPAALPSEENQAPRKRSGAPYP